MMLTNVIMGGMPRQGLPPRFGLAHQGPDLFQHFKLKCLKKVFDKRRTSSERDTRTPGLLEGGSPLVVTDLLHLPAHRQRTHNRLLLLNNAFAVLPGEIVDQCLGQSL